MILGIDPGVNCGATLLGDNGILLVSALFRAPKGGGEADRAAALAGEIWSWAGGNGVGLGSDKLVLEWPQVYQGGKQKGDPNDLLFLAAIDGALAAKFPTVQVIQFKPQQWKGQVPKEIMTKRILGKLRSDEEKTWKTCTQSVPSSLVHNVVDSLGIALHAAGRL